MKSRENGVRTFIKYREASNGDGLRVVGASWIPCYVRSSRVNRREIDTKPEKIQGRFETYVIVMGVSDGKTTPRYSSIELLTRAHRT